MSTGWDPQQREWLQAMGYELMVPASMQAGPAEQAVAADVPDPGHAAPLQDRRRARAEASAWSDGPLLRALLRAAGRPDRDVLVAALPPAARLRADPAAKRALWPRLRAMRRAARH